MPFERRWSPRWPVDGQATVLRVAGERFGETHELTLLNLSGGGLGARCDMPIEPGATVSVGFAQRDQLARRGTVTRCVPCGNGYEVAIQFELGLAA